MDCLKEKPPTSGLYPSGSSFPLDFLQEGKASPFKSVQKLAVYIKSPQERNTDVLHGRKVEEKHEIIRTALHPLWPWRLNMACIYRSKCMGRGEGAEGKGRAAVLCPLPTQWLLSKKHLLNLLLLFWVICFDVLMSNRR